MNTRDDSLLEAVADEEMKERDQPKVAYICGGKSTFTQIILATL